MWEEKKERIPPEEEGAGAGVDVADVITGGGKSTSFNSSSSAVVVAEEEGSIALQINKYFIDFSWKEIKSSKGARGEGGGGLAGRMAADKLFART